MTRNESVLWLAAGLMLAFFLSSGCGAFKAGDDSSASSAALRVSFLLTSPVLNAPESRSALNADAHSTHST